MTVAQGIYKKLAYKKQSALGTAASGGSGQYLRREKSSFNKMKDTYSNDEIVSHQQYTGDTYGVGKTKGDLDGVLSPGTYATLLASLLRKDMTATAAITSCDADDCGLRALHGRSLGRLVAYGRREDRRCRPHHRRHLHRHRARHQLAGYGRGRAYADGARSQRLDADGAGAGCLLDPHRHGQEVGRSGHRPHERLLHVRGVVQRPLAQPHLCRHANLDAEIGIPATGNSTIKMEALGLSRAKGSSQVLTSRQRRKRRLIS
jgi:hypothetical protein